MSASTVILGVSAGLQALGIIFGGRAARAEQLAKAREMKIQQKINEINAISAENELARNYQEITEATLTTPKGSPSMVTGGKKGKHSENLALILSTMKHLPRKYPDAKW